MNEKPEDIEANVEEYGPKPDETSGFVFSSFIKIHDPNTQEILVQLRGDN